MFGVSWECPVCCHSWKTFFEGKLKRELKEELEDGMQLECLVCEKNREVNESNATIIKNED